MVVYDPKVREASVRRDLDMVCGDSEKARKLVRVVSDVYEAVKDAHAFVVCTEWDEFKVSATSI